jgi:dipeptidyl aminopeptidase/acylaminoacyl peptidase
MLTRLLLSSALALAFAAPVLAAPAETRIGTATLQGVPPVPATIKAAVQRYQNYRAAAFEDWLPDGSLLIATRFGGTQQLHRVAGPGADRRQLTFFDDPVTSAEAIPGSDTVALVRDTGGDEWFQIEVMGPSGLPVAMTEPGTRNQSPVFAKDGKAMLWSRAVKGSGDYAILAATPGDPASRRVAWAGKGAISPADISADGKRALIVRGISNSESELLLLDIAAGSVTPVTVAKALYQDPHFTADGRGIVALTDVGSDVRRLVEIDTASGRITELTPGLKWDVASYTLSDDGHILAYVVNEDGFSRVVVADRVLRRALPQPALPRGAVTGIGFSPDGKRLAIGLTTATSAGDIWAWSVASAELVRWTNSELGPLDQAKLVEPELIRFKSFDGRSIPAFVYRPHGVKPGARVPVIMDIHGGPEAQSLPGWNPGAQYFADVLGAAVILPNVRGSDGYGKAWRALDNAEKREDSVKDIGALLDWIGTQPGLDAGRVAVYGQSYGGYMSLAVMTHYADRLVGGVERYGISDFRSFLERTEAYRRDNRRAEYGDERDPAMQKVFARIAPIANVKKITKPMLVMQGSNDPRVPQYESDRIVEAIRGNGVDAWYVVFADEGHGFMKKLNNDLRREVETVFLGQLFAR